MARLIASAVTLDRKIDLQSFSFARDNMGERRQAWSTYAADVRAMVLEGRSVRAGEIFEEDQHQARVGKEFIVRYRDDVRPQHRVIWEGRAYDITGATEMTRAGYRRRSWLKIVAAARAE